MIVKVADYGFNDDEAYVEYRVSDLNLKQLEILDKQLTEETELHKKEKYLILKVYYDREFFPFISDESKVKIEDYIAREEIEMEIFLSSFLEDFN